MWDFYVCVSLSDSLGCEEALSINAWLMTNKRKEEKNEKAEINNVGIGDSRGLHGSGAFLAETGSCRRSGTARPSWTYHEDAG
jgi:hypothetical protein